MSRIITGLCLGSLLFAGGILAKENTRLKIEDREPEAATGLIAKQAVSAKDFMVAAANPYASEAGFNILKQGGSAVDAAIAVQLVLTLVEPQSSGIGGGALFCIGIKASNCSPLLTAGKPPRKKLPRRCF